MGRMTTHIFWKIRAMFETTNQYKKKKLQKPQIPSNLPSKPTGNGIGGPLSILSQHRISWELGEHH
jgi:hypothetical protein